MATEPSRHDTFRGPTAEGAWRVGEKAIGWVGRLRVCFLIGAVEWVGCGLVSFLIFYSRLIPHVWSWPRRIQLILDDEQSSATVDRYKQDVGHYVTLKTTRGDTAKVGSDMLVSHPMNWIPLPHMGHSGWIPINDDTSLESPPLTS
jgi:hypothetical protein